MIVGTGVDIIEIDRVRESHRRHGDRFLKRIFTESEMKYCLKKKDPYPSLAARFAAKEAAVKAFADGFARGWKWTDLEVLRSAGGKPGLAFHGSFATAARKRKITDAHLTLSHSKRDAVALVVLECRK